MAAAICLCSDLDRTILPNGFQEESPGVRHVLRKIVKHPAMTLVYVTGRNQALVICSTGCFSASACSMTSTAISGSL